MYWKSAFCCFSSTVKAFWGTTLVPAAAVFLISSVGRGCIKGPGFYTQPALGSFVQKKKKNNFPEFLLGGPRVSWKLRAGPWLVAKTGRFPFSGDEKPPLFPSSCPLQSRGTALHFTLKGLPKEKLFKKNMGWFTWNPTTALGFANYLLTLHFGCFPFTLLIIVHAYVPPTSALVSLYGRVKHLNWTKCK